MSHLSLYRKYRSQSFHDLVGQQHVVRTLQNALATGRIAQAYLFTGPRGTGKTSTARLLSKALNCENGPSPEPCNTCVACTSITSGTSFDVLEIDAATESGVENVRDLIASVADYPPSHSRYKVVIVDEVHDLSRPAFDALLKTLEEPPAHLIFILATTEYVKVPPTIRSRCQKFEFHRGSIPDLVSRLNHVAEREQIQIEPAAIAAIARMADGGYRDALTLLEQAMVMNDGVITLDHIYNQLGLLSDDMVDTILQAMKDQDIPQLIETLGTAIQLGRDPKAIVESLTHRLSELTRAAYGQMASAEGAAQAAFHEAAARIGMPTILRFRSELAHTHAAIRDVTIPRVWLESELIRIATANSVPAPAPATIQVPAPVQPAKAPTPAVAQAPAAQNAEPVATPESEGPLTPEQVWKKTVQGVTIKSKTLGMKLQSTRVAGFEDGRLRIAFARKIERDMAVEGPKGPEKRAAILEYLRASGGEGWDIEYVADDSESNGVQMAAVELAATGERLVELTDEILSNP